MRHLVILLVIAYAISTATAQSACKQSEREYGWYEDCNWCACPGGTGNGNAFCTLKGCGIQRSELDQTCKGDVEFYRGRDNTYCQCQNEVLRCE